MVSITLSIPEQVKHQMNMFTEVNWSGFVRQKIIEKTEEMAWKKKMLQKLEKEEQVNVWAVNLQRKSRKGRFKELKSKRVS
ncbi:MAG: hypothetical protein KKG60_04145 [Nanoarchaeota archaeon]|nr:hypothetical protein [Nanoarchaeota archaeon]